MCVRLSVYALKGKWLELATPKVGGDMVHPWQLSDSSITSIL